METNNLIKLKWMEKDYRYYLNKSTILFGASNSGKSTILLEILYLLKDQVPNIFVFAPTAEENNAFDNIVPKSLVFQELSIEKLSQIYKRQQAATKIFNTANNIKDLKYLFEIVAKQDEKTLVEKIYLNSELTIRKINNNKKLDFASKKSKIADVNEIRAENIKKIYKSVIRKNKERFENIKDKYKYIVKYLDFNPNCVVVLDDCGAELKKFQNNETVKKIIFQGRHSHINIIMTLQDDLNLNSAIKKNAFVNIFTTSQCASAYFERASNSYSKKTKEKASKIINYIFSESENGIKNYKKLVYLRGHMDPFRCTIADVYENWQFGSPHLWKLCKKLEKNDSNCDFENDPLLSKFKI